MREVPIAINLPGCQIFPPQTTSSITPLASSTSASKIRYSANQGSPNRPRGSDNSQINMCDVSATFPSSLLGLDFKFVNEFDDSGLAPCQVCHLRPRAQKAGKIYPTCGLTCAAVFNKTGPNLEGNSLTMDLFTKSYQSFSPSYHSSGTRQPYKQHDSYGHSQSLRGSTQAATTCVVCFLSLLSLSLQLLPYNFP